jgi:hypothetical protein
MFLDVDWTNCFGTLIEYVAERMLFDSPMRFYLYTVTKSTWGWGGNENRSYTVSGTLVRTFRGTAPVPGTVPGTVPVVYCMSEVNEIQTVNYDQFSWPDPFDQGLRRVELLLLVPTVLVRRRQGRSLKQEEQQQPRVLWCSPIDKVWCGHQWNKLLRGANSPRSTRHKQVVYFEKHEHKKTQRQRLSEQTISLLP